MLTNFTNLLVQVKIKKVNLYFPISLWAVKQFIYNLIDLFDLIGWKTLNKLSVKFDIDKENISRRDLFALAEILSLLNGKEKYDLVDIDIKEEKVKIKVKVL